MMGLEPEHPLGKSDSASAEYINKTALDSSLPIGVLFAANIEH
jgi:hypothetical protein